MGRPRGFEEADVLEHAVTIFRRNGYTATTFAMLETETGVGVRSLVNAFGDKEALFLRVLDRYEAEVREVVDALFDPPSLDGVQRVWEAMLDTAQPGDIRHHGCLMVNTAFDQAALPEAVRARVASYREMWRGAFIRALQAEGVALAERRAEFLLSTLWGLLAQIRMAGDMGVAKPAAEVTLSTMERWAA